MLAKLYFKNRRIRNENINSRRRIQFCRCNIKQTKKEKYAVDIFCDGEEGVESALTNISIRQRLKNKRCNKRDN